MSDAGRQKRVLLLEQGEGLWGPQRALLALAPLLDGLGFDQVLAGPPGPLADAWQSAGRSHECVPAPRTRSIRNAAGRLSVWRAVRELVRTASSSLRIARIARAHKVDVIVAHNHWSHLEGVLAGRIARVPVVVHLHEHHQDDALGRLRRIAVTKAQRTIAVSDSIRSALPAHAQRRVDVIRNGTAAVDAVPSEAIADLRSELGVRGRVVLALARYQPEKGLDDLIEAMSRLPAAFGDVQVLLAGGSREDDSYERRLRSLAGERAPGHVQFLGFRTDAAELLALADVCVLPSRREGLPLVALEAQAAGCPLIAAAVGGIPEVVEHDATGFLFPAGDIPALTAALQRLLDDEELRDRLRRTALERVAREATVERQAEAYAELLRSVT